MRSAETVLNIIRERGQKGQSLVTTLSNMVDTMVPNSRNRLLASCLTRKSVTGSSEERGWKSGVLARSSLAPYPTSCTVRDWRWGR